MLQAAGRYDTFLSLLDSTDLVSRLDDPTHFITILAPTDAGVNAWLENRGTTLAALEGSGSVLEGIMEYHILPSPVLVSHLKVYCCNSRSLLALRTMTYRCMSKHVFHVEEQHVACTTAVGQCACSVCRGAMLASCCYSKIWHQMLRRQ